MPRVGIIAWLHESNTFVSARTTLAHFERDLLATGETIRERFADAHHEIGGFFAGLAEHNIEAVPIFAARALPYGIITTEAFDALLLQMLETLDAAGPLDGILVAPHGATVAENAADADGFWLTKLREHVGPKLPIIGTLDLHANLSEAMVRACTALIGYRTNPHLDQRERGVEAATLMARTLRGEVRPIMAARFPPMIVNIERQLTAEEPCQSLYALADEQLQYPLVLSNSICLGFPYADVPEMGASVIVITDGDDTIAGNFADDLALALWENRAAFQGQFISVEDAVARAMQSDVPVCLLDMGDNIGGGSPGNSTIIARELLRQAVPRSFVCIADTHAVQQLAETAIGSRVKLIVGEEPLEIAGVLRSRSSGRFREPNPRHGGFAEFDQGATAVVTTDNGLSVMLSTERMVPFSLNQLVENGVNPEEFRVFVAKGVHAPVAAYIAICQEFIRVNTPGCTTADVMQLNYAHRRRPLYPFEMTEG